jgi:hypothetical protein
MKTDALLPDLSQVVTIDGRTYLPVSWDEADVLHEALRKNGCRTTLCLNPETREARLELWPGVTPDGVRAALDGRPPSPGGVTPSPETADRKWAATDPAAAAADLICI